MSKEEMTCIEHVLKAVTEEKKVRAALSDQAAKIINPLSWLKFLEKYEGKCTTELGRSCVHYYKREFWSKIRYITTGILGIALFIVIFINLCSLLRREGTKRYEKELAAAEEAERLENRVQSNLEREFYYKHLLLERRPALQGSHKEFINILANNKIISEREISGTYADLDNGDNYMSLIINPDVAISEGEVGAIGDVQFIFDLNWLHFRIEDESWSTSTYAFATDYKGNDMEPEIFHNEYDIDLWHDSNGKLNADIISWETGETIGTFRKVTNSVSDATLN